MARNTKDTLLMIREKAKANSPGKTVEYMMASGKTASNTAEESLYPKTASKE